MKSIDNLTLNDLTQQDYYYSILYLLALGFDVEKNTSKAMLESMVELKQIALNDKTTIKQMYLNEKKSTLN